MAALSRRIDRDEMYRLLLEALPEFRERWAAQQTGHAGDPRGLPDHPALGDISRHAVYETQHRRHQPMDLYRDTLDLLVRRGDAFVRRVARDLLHDLDHGMR